MRIKKVIINSIHLDVLQNYQILYTLKEVEGGGGGGGGGGTGAPGFWRAGGVQEVGEESTGSEIPNVVGTRRN